MSKLLLVRWVLINNVWWAFHRRIVNAVNGRCSVVVLVVFVQRAEETRRTLLHIQHAHVARGLTDGLRACCRSSFHHLVFASWTQDDVSRSTIVRTAEVAILIGCPHTFRHDSVRAHVILAADLALLAW